MADKGLLNTNRNKSGDLLWIDSQPALDSFCAEAACEPFIAVDTEFHREKTYFAELALVQVGAAGKIACIDPLSGIDLAPLDALLQNVKVLKLMHAARQDMEIFFDRTGRLPSPVFDTQVAAALLGMGEQTGYGALVEKVCGVPLSKLHVRTDWMRRPLDAGVIAYAADDVRYLPDLYRHLDEALEGKGRRAWLEEEQAVLCDLSTYETDAPNAWKKLKGAGKLKGVSLAVGRQLAAWREEEARRANRPKKWILTDEAIIDLARQKPVKASALARMRGLDEKVRRKYGEELAGLVACALKIPEKDWPPPLGQGERMTVDDALVNALSAIVQLQAGENRISAGMLASRKDLELAAAGEENIPLYKGWRKALAGGEVKAFLKGELRLQVVSGRLVTAR